MKLPLRSRRWHVNGIRLRTVLAGEGPLVVLVHGFPESWYSWRHQIQPIASRGYRVCAIDVRGYGRSDRPHGIAAYAMSELIEDVAGIVTLLGDGKPAVLIGHDWGAPIVWHTALVRPDKVRAVAGLSVPYMGIPPWPLDQMLDERYTQRQRFHYQVYFAQEGVAEAAFETDIRSTLRRIYYSASGDAPPGSWSNKTFGAALLDGVPDPQHFPSWLTPRDIDYLVREFQRSGFRGPLNRYRNHRHDYEFLSPYRERKIEQPSLYIGGTRDLVLSMVPGGDPGAAMRANASDVRGIHMIEGCGHWTQQERPAETTQYLLDWLDDIDR